MLTFDVFISELTNYLEDNKKQCEERYTILLKEECKDEANFEKIKKNVYEIVPSFMNAAEQKIKSKDMNDNVIEFYKELRLKIENLSSTWKSKLDRARENDHIENVVIEELKVLTINDVLQRIDFISQK